MCFGPQAAKFDKGSVEDYKITKEGKTAERNSLYVDQIAAAAVFVNCFGRM